MKESINEIKREVKAKWLFWQRIESKRLKVALILLFLVLVGIKIFTTVLTFDWLANLFA